MGTARQELVRMAANKLSMLKHQNRYNRFGARVLPTAHDALEAVIDGTWLNEPDTLGREMFEYYKNLSDVALSRLINEVARKAARNG